MTDIRVFRRRRTRRDGDCPTGMHRQCDITVVTGRSLGGSLYMMSQFQFEPEEDPTLDLICIDGDLAAVIAGAENLRIDGLGLLRELAGSEERSEDRTTGICACGNNPSPADGFCSNCRPRKRGSRSH